MSVHTRAFAPQPLARPSGDAAPHRAYDIGWLDAEGAARWDTRRLPAVPALEAAVAMFGLGTPLDTPRGPVPVEDLQPGDVVRSDRGDTAIQWIGIRVFPAAEPRPALYRVSARAFGDGRPTGPLVLGAGASLLVTGPACRPFAGGEAAFVPIAAREDGMAVAELSPPGDVTLFGVALRDHGAVLAGGVPVGAWHPARSVAMTLTRDGLRDVARLCPPAEEGGFGPVRIPHLTLAEGRDLVG